METKKKSGITKKTLLLTIGVFFIVLFMSKPILSESLFIKILVVSVLILAFFVFLKLFNGWLAIILNKYSSRKAADQDNNSKPPA